MEIKNKQDAIFGGAGVIVGLIMMSIPLAALVVGVALIIGGAYFLGTGVDFRDAKVKEVKPEEKVMVQ